MNENEFNKNNENVFNKNNMNGIKPARKPILPLVIVLIVGIVVGALATTGGFFLEKYFGNRGVASVITGTGTSETAGDLTDVSGIVANTMPSVVCVTSMTTAKNINNGNFFYFFGDSNNSSGKEVESSLGSGVIIATTDTELLILTSYHVVENSSSVVVKFCNEKEVTGSLKSAESAEDLAIVTLKLSDIDSETLSAIKVATICQKEVRVGEGVIAIGNALGYGQSVTSGIVSAVNKDVTVSTGTKLSLIQTDAAINSGNSGGGLFNAKGELVGINEAKYTSESIEGMCFAIPVSDKAEMIQNLINETPRPVIPENERGFLGIYGVDATEYMAEVSGATTGVYIQSIIKGGAAEKAGLEKSDIIVSIDGDKVSSMQGLQDLLTHYKVGEKVKVKYYSAEGGSYVEKEAEVTLGASEK